MPGVWDEHAGAELAVQLHLTPGAAEGLLSLAHDLAVKLPLTAAALRDGIIDLDKARTIAWYCFPLTPAEARAAEKILLGLAGVEEMTWGMIRDRIARAVIEVNPEAARRRREEAAKDKRVEVVTEQSGNCQLAGRELPPAAVLAASENLTGRALELRAAGVPGGMDELRALAYLEALGALDPLEHAAATGDGPGGDDPGGTGRASGTGSGPGSGGDGGRGPDGPRPGPGPAAGPGRSRPGFAARVNLTIPLATLLGLAERPGTLSRTGPVDPALARELAAAAARSPRSTWCVTVTGPDHRPLAHGCGRPPPRGRDNRGTAAARDGPLYTPGDDYGPPGTGNIQLDIAALTGTTGRTGTGARRAAGGLVFALENLAGPCDHKHQADRARPGGPAAAPDRDLERLLHLPALPPPAGPVRLRAQHPAREGRPDLPVPGRAGLPPQPPRQAGPRLAPPTRRRPRLVPLDHPLRPQLPQPPHPIPRLINTAREPGRGGMAVSRATRALVIARCSGHGPWLSRRSARRARLGHLARRSRW